VAEPAARRPDRPEPTRPPVPATPARPPADPRRAADYHPPLANPFGGPDSATFDSSSLWAPSTPSVEGSSGFLPATPLPAGEAGRSRPETAVSSLGGRSGAGDSDQRSLGNPFTRAADDRATRPDAGEPDGFDGFDDYREFGADEPEAERPEPARDEPARDDVAARDEDAGHYDEPERDESAGRDEAVDDPADTADADDGFGWPEFDEPDDEPDPPSRGSRSGQLREPRSAPDQSDGRSLSRGAAG
jgi:hypothetical protein